MKKQVAIMLTALACALALALCGCAGSSGSGSSASADGSASSAESAATESASAQDAATQQSVAPGEYLAKFDTDSSMFHINEADEGRGVLTVTDEGMTIHIHLVSKKIVNLYAGTADQAQADEANIIQPTTDKVTYSDGYEEEVYGFDVPVPALDQEFDVAILGEKGTWYDHKVTVSDPITEQK